MKAYIINIEIRETQPLIWRRVIMPAGATFRRLHDVIQIVTNFQSEANHLYRFDLSKENIVVTNDEETFLEYDYLKKNRKHLEDRIKTMQPAFRKFEERRLEGLNTLPRKPTGLKIDDYLEKFDKINYTYDFGDDWELTIVREKTVEDYYFGYPTLLDGEETAPPEDVGGIPGFYSFLEILQDEKHNEHQQIKDWAKGQGFRLYDPEFINYIFKSLHYKKTQWNKINHQNYKIVEDKYRLE